MKCLFCDYYDSVNVDGETYCELCAERYRCENCGEYTKGYCSCFKQCPCGVWSKEVYCCPECVAEHTCCRCGAVGNMLEIDGELYCDDCSMNFVICDDCGEYTEHYVSDENNVLCESCFDYDYFYCTRCEGIFHFNEGVNEDGYMYCVDCAHETRPAGEPIESDSFEIIPSARWYGVEIETSRGDYDETPYRWGIHEDCSIGGLELVSPLMQGDEGLESIREVYEDVRPEFDDRCGLHVHVDVRDLSCEQLFEVIKAFKETKNKWFDYVDSSRWSNRYCEFDLPELCDDFTEYFNKASRKRYTWLNLQAVEKHGSIEIRLHEGTGNVEKVVKWVTMLVNFVSDVVAV